MLPGWPSITEPTDKYFCLLFLMGTVLQVCHAQWRGWGLLCLKSILHYETLHFFSSVLIHYTYSIIPAYRAQVPNELQQSNSLSDPLFWGKSKLIQLASSFMSSFIHLINIYWNLHCSWHLSGFYWEYKIKETDKHSLHLSYAVVQVTMKSQSFSIVGESGFIL